MKVKTSITLDRDVLASVDRLAKRAGGRSAFIERAVRIVLQMEERARREAKDKQLLDRHAEELSKVMEDVLRYQVDT